MHLMKGSRNLLVKKFHFIIQHQKQSNGNRFWSWLWVEGLAAFLPLQRNFIIASVPSRQTLASG